MALPLRIGTSLVRSGLVCLNSLAAAVKWISASTNSAVRLKSALSPRGSIAQHWSHTIRKSLALRCALLATLAKQIAL